MSALLLLLRRRLTSPSTAIATNTARKMGTLPKTPLFEALHAHAPNSTAITHSSSGKHFTYASLLRDVAALRPRLPTNETRVAILAENSYEYVGTVQGRVPLGAHPAANSDGQ